MDEVTSTIVKKFNFKPKHIYKNKYMYICNTDKGIKLIRPVNYTTDKILFVHNIKQHLIKQGFNQLDCYYMSQDNLPYVLNEDMIYIMTDYIDLQECDLSKSNDTKKAIELIANFHKLSQGYNTDNIKEDINTIDIKEDFIKKLDNLKKMKRTVSKQKKIMDFELSFIRTYDYFYKSAIESIDILEKYKYEDLNILAKNNVMICHNKLKEENILIGNRCYLTQLENITIDHYIYDIASFIIRYIKKHSDDYLSLEQILTTYSKINYINGSILPILYALIKFPTKYIETCQSFFDRRRNFTPISISSDLQSILDLKDFQENYISKIKL
ncbi:CotS family spore coat protein [uncultured Tyzzerella sp.]|uniref:CotS family spore coat protein n=1 Tax=uncultured Tyzzerella sp. TaxID=2321398 RepID=UPI0029433AAC|nr:CotS family spore coat protein [uncultured Tyzzerella sp.]